MKDVVIVLPVYKLFNDLTENELKSLKQLNCVLRDFTLSIVTTESFCLDDYIKFFGEKNLQIERFDEKYFKSKVSYNKLCLSLNFYRRFLQYRYMLIYQYDAYVFRNELKSWIEQGYDYIGAPFYEDTRKPFDLKTWTVGNGGFCLRSVKKCYQLLARVEFYYVLVKLSGILQCKRFITKVFMKLGLINLALIERIRRNKYHEDQVFGILSKYIHKNFSVAPIEVAWQFSFEAYPTQLYELNNKKLPFGCHGWDINEPEFWKNFI